MGREGHWSLASRQDPRWQADGDSLSFDGRSVPPEAKRALEALRKQLGSAPPPDVTCRFHPLQKSLPTTALAELFQSHLLAAADKLESFAALFPEGEEGGSKFHPETCELLFLDWDQQPTRRYSAQALGFELTDSRLWRWAWQGDELPQEATRVARRLFKFGQERQIAEFINAQVPLGNSTDRSWFNAEYLALICCGLAGAHATVAVSHGDKLLHLLVTVPDGLPPAESVAVRMGVVLRKQFSRWGEGFPARTQRRALRAYAQLNKCELQEISELEFNLRTPPPKQELLKVHFEPTGAFRTFEYADETAYDGSLESVELDAAPASASPTGWWKIVCQSDARWNCQGQTASRDEFCTPPEADEAIERMKRQFGQVSPIDLEIDFQAASQQEEFLDLAPLDARPSSALRTLFAAHAARSHEKQLQLADYLAGEAPEWKLLPEEGILRLHLKERRIKVDLPIQFLGLVSYRQETQWQWAWSDLEYDIPKGLLKGVEKLRRLGIQNELSELSDPHFPLGPETDQPWFNGNFLALIASGFCGADFFYSIPWDEKIVLYLLVQDSDLTSEAPQTGAAMTRSLRDFLNHWAPALAPESHLQLIQAYTRQKGCTATLDQSDKREFKTPAGDTLRVLFDRDSRISGVEFNSVEPRLPDRGTVPTMPTAIVPGNPRGATGAMHLVKKLLGRGQSAATDYVERSKTSLETGDWDSAHADLCEALRLEPDNVAAWGLRGEGWLDHGNNVDQALADLQEALMRGGPNPHLLTIRARAWLKKEQYEQAATDCSEALRVDGEFLEAYLIRGDAFAEQGHHDQAIADYTEYSHRVPLDPRSFVRRARCWQVQRSTVRAEQDLVRARELGWDGSPPA